MRREGREVRLLTLLPHDSSAREEEPLPARTRTRALHLRAAIFVERADRFLKLGADLRRQVQAIGNLKRLGQERTDPFDASSFLSRRSRPERLILTAFQIPSKGIDSNNTIHGSNSRGLQGNVGAVYMLFQVVSIKVRIECVAGFVGERQAVDTSSVALGLRVTSSSSRFQNPASGARGGRWHTRKIDSPVTV